MKRTWLLVAVLACGLGMPYMASAAQVDFSLNLEFNNPLDFSSGGTWTVVATSDERGIAAADLRLTNITFDSATGPLSPLIEYSIGPDAGFSVSQEFDLVTHLDLLQAEDVATPNLLFYDVGVIGGATQPGENGTPNVPAGISSRQVPWGTYVDDPQLTIFGAYPDLGSFTGGVELVTGTFGSTVPDWFDGGPTDRSDANVFTTVPFIDRPSSIAGANVSLTVRYVVPEPSAIVLAVMGLMGLSAGRRRR
jgi:hypothetical protein